MSTQRELDSLAVKPSLRDQASRTFFARARWDWVRLDVRLDLGPEGTVAVETDGRV